MSKRHALEHTFEQALKTEFRWPKKGDNPFAEAPEPLNNALIAEDEHTRLVLMTDGYKRAADSLVRHTIDEPSSRDFFVLSF